MKLQEFGITDYRSVNDSGPVAVGKVTSLVGRNESGKTALLLALQSLNPPGGIKDLLPIKDFPRHRRLSECKDDTPVVVTVWELTPEERAELAKIFPRAKDVTTVEIGRRYKAKRWVEFRGLQPLEFSGESVASRVSRIAVAMSAAAAKIFDTLKPKAEEVIRVFKEALGGSQATDWAARAAPALAAFRAGIGEAGLTLGEREESLLAELEDLAATIKNDPASKQAAVNWVIGRLPVFVYVDDYPALTGHQNIAEYLARKAANPSQLTPADLNFEKMCKVADLNPQQLHDLLAANDHETRNQLTNRSGAIVTSELRRLWKDRQLKVRFSPDANHLDTFISDPNSVYDVEVNLDERSRGLKWFFSFYITFSADTKGGVAENAVLLLDEPGLYLHALSQGDLLRHLSADFRNQIIYTTHSPFMVPTENLDAVRTVNIGQDAGTTVTNSPSGDERTLFPLQAALGFSLSQSLFVGPENLVVEGVTDYWILSCASEHLIGLGRSGLPKSVTLTPAGGAQKIGYMVALLTSERLHVFVLFDDEKQARGTRDELVKSKLIRDEHVIFITEGFEKTAKPAEADIEDLLDPDVYEGLVRESYGKELGRKALRLNAMIPRMVKRYEQAFADLGLEFHKTRPARLLLAKMAQEPEKIMTPSAADRFARLFERIGEAHAKKLAREPAPFR